MRREIIQATADEVVDGDHVVNLGKVVARHTLGAFLILTIEASVWSLATGLRGTNTFNHVLHRSDDIALEIL